VAGWSTLGGRDDRVAVVPFWIAGAGLVLVTIAAWIFVIVSSGDDSMDMVPSAGAYVGSWTVMMAAMMLPSVAPFALLYARGASTPAAPGLLAAGYLGVWALVGIPAYALDRALGMDHPAATAAVLIAAGLYQLSPLKQACLKGCRSPVDFLVQHWRPGRGVRSASAPTTARIAWAAALRSWRCWSSPAAWGSSGWSRSPRSSRPRSSFPAARSWARSGE
jgi:hypothetical protein